MRSSVVVRWPLGGPKLFRTVIALLIGSSSAASFASTSDVAITARDLVDVRDLSSLAVSPDGEFAAVRLEQSHIKRNATELSWHVMALRSPYEARRVADAGEAIRSEGVLEAEIPQWSADSTWFYYRALNGTEVQVWRTRGDGTASEKLTNDSGDIESFTLDSKANRLFYEVGPSREAVLRAERHEYETGVVHTAGMTSGRRETSGETSPLGSVPSVLKVLDLASREVHPASEEEQGAFDSLTERIELQAEPRATQVQQEAGGDRVAFLAPLDPPDKNPPKSRKEAILKRLASPPAKYRVSWVPSPAAEQAAACAEPVCFGRKGRLNGIAWRPGTPEIVMLANGPNGSSESGLYAWNTQTGAVRNIVSGGTYSTIESAVPSMCPIAQDQAICITAAAASPPAIEAIDLRDGRRRVLFDPNLQLRQRRFGAVESLTWQDAQGNSSHGYLLLPPRPQPIRNAPLVITTYWCGGFLRGGVGNEYPEHVLTGMGFAVLCANLDPSRMVAKDASGKWLPIPHIKSYVASWEAVVDLLAKRGVIDAKRVGVSGLSFGGRSVLYAISHSKHFAVAATSGGSDLEPFSMFLRTTPGDMPTAIRQLEGLPPPMDDPEQIWQKVSPSRNADRIDAPLLIQVADAEFPSDVLELKAYMRRANKPIDIVIFPDEGHQKWQPVHKLAVYERNVDWFRFWLQGYEDPHEGKQEQYVRWRGLRELGKPSE